MDADADALSVTPRVTHVRAYHRPSEGNCYPYFVTPPPIILVVKSLNEISVGAMLSLIRCWISSHNFHIFQIYLKLVGVCKCLMQALMVTAHCPLLIDPTMYETEPPSRRGIFGETS